MDYQDFVDTVDMPCCVLSVEKVGDSYGDIRIVCSNTRYKDVMGSAYHDNMLYYELVPKDNKFEDYCYRAAVLGQCMRAYVNTKAFDCWTDQTLIPLSSDRDDTGYCEYTFNLTETAESDRMAAVSMDVANIVLQISMTIIRGDSFKGSLGKVLDIIVDESGAKGCRVIYLDDDKKQVIHYGEKMAEGYWPKDNREIITYDLVKEWESVIGVSSALIIKDEHDMEEVEKADPEWAAGMRGSGVTSLVLVPLHREKKVVGYLYVVNFDTDKVVEIKESLEMASYILGTEIANHHLVKKLEELSSVDELTGVRNRHAMHRMMDHIHSTEGMMPFGIVNIDLNGLKVVNDKYGHEAGDMMLVQASEILQKVFYQEDIFRTGGDEFMVILDGIEEKALANKIMRLREDMEKNAEVSFAIGDVWSDGSTDLIEAMREADERMYADKEAYYEKHPENRR